MSAIDGTELDGYEALVSELRATAPVAPERLRGRVLEGAPAPRRRRSKRRRLALVVVPAAFVLAVGAAVVHGFVNSRLACRQRNGGVRESGDCLPALGDGTRPHARARRKRPEDSPGRLAPGGRRAGEQHEEAAPRSEKVGHDPDEPARPCDRLAPGAGLERLGSLEGHERGVADRRFARRLCPVRPVRGEPPRRRERSARAPRPGPEGSDRDRAARRISASSSRSRSRPRTCRRS